MKNPHYFTETGALSGVPFHVHEGADPESLEAALNSKLTANAVETQSPSVATDVAGLVADFNVLLEKLKTAGVMS